MSGPESIVQLELTRAGIAQRMREALVAQEAFQEQADAAKHHYDGLALQLAGIDRALDALVKEAQ